MSETELNEDKAAENREALAVPVERCVMWLPISTAPNDGRRALVFRPLANKSNDEPIAIKRLIGGDNFCWADTVPSGQMPCNPTDGACHVTHWAPLPDKPAT